ncbi:hypothetical protein MRX96_032825 [Rhipicephalus microplus]
MPGGELLLDDKLSWAAYYVPQAPTPTFSGGVKQVQPAAADGSAPKSRIKVDRPRIGLREAIREGYYKQDMERGGELEKATYTRAYQASTRNEPQALKKQRVNAGLAEKHSSDTGREGNQKLLLEGKTLEYKKVTRSGSRSISWNTVAYSYTTRRVHGTAYAKSKERSGNRGDLKGHRYTASSNGREPSFTPWNTKALAGRRVGWTLMLLILPRALDARSGRVQRGRIYGATLRIRPLSIPLSFPPPFSALWLPPLSASWQQPEAPCHNAFSPRFISVYKNEAPPTSKPLACFHKPPAFCRPVLSRYASDPGPAWLARAAIEDS